MYRVNEVPVTIEQNVNNKNLKQILSKYLEIKEDNILDFKINKRSLDSRKKQNIHYKFSFDFNLVSKVDDDFIKKYNLQEIKYELPEKVDISESNKFVVVVGSGPAGLFSALTLCKAGVKVLLLERGEKIEDRVITVSKLLKEGRLNKESNIQFGEGGAGTFSDGKLNTGINSLLVKEVLKTFYDNGADESVLYDSKPHIGTDKLRGIVKNIRNEIIEQGGIVSFNSKFTDFIKKKDKIEVVYYKDGKQNKVIADDLILALGYSARDTHRHLFDKGLKFSQKAFSVGYRIEHLQEDINKAQYGENYNKLLPPADYKLFVHLNNGRTVYTFCMCPGGEVVPAINSENQIVTNGMSYHLRNGKNANSAILVNVNERDYGSNHPLAGLEYQEKLEEYAYKKSCGEFIVSKFGDFKNNKASVFLGKVKPTIKPKYKLGNVYELLPEDLSASIKEGIILFGRKLKGFDNDDACLTGIETRSSAPFMVNRDENLKTNIEHIYSIGEGAGMAGGIVSSAVDGIKIANKIIQNYLKD